MSDDYDDDDMNPNVEMQKLADMAKELGLHGVFILSKKCPDCGNLHNFAMLSDMSPSQTEGLPALLREWAERADEDGVTVTRTH